MLSVMCARPNLLYLHHGIKQSVEISAAAPGALAEGINYFSLE